MNLNVPVKNPAHLNNSRVLRPNRSHLTSVRRQNRDRYRVIPQGYQLPPSRNRQPGTMVGNAPVLWISGSAGPVGSADRGFWPKLQGFNPGGMKDRPAMHMVERASARGDLAPGAAIIESTSGTLGLELALADNAYRHPVTLVTDPGLEPIIARMLTAYGARVEMVTKPHPVGRWQQARKDRVAGLLAADPGAWNPNQYSNPDNVDAYRPLALDLVAQLGKVDVLVCSVGTGGHSAGVARVLREFNPDMRLVGVDTIGSTIFGQPATSRLMRGLASSIYPRNVDHAAFNEVHWVVGCSATGPPPIPTRSPRPRPRSLPAGHAPPRWWTRAERRRDGISHPIPQLQPAQPAADDQPVRHQRRLLHADAVPG